MIPETLDAADFLEREGVGANVIHLCSPRRAYDDWRTHRGGDGRLLDTLIPSAQRAAPIVSVLDGRPGHSPGSGAFSASRSPHSAWGASGSPAAGATCTGMKIDTDSIVEAAFDAVERALF